MDWNVLSSLGTAASAAIAIIAFWAFSKQVRQGHENITTSILREHEKQFFYSDDFPKIREDACRFLKAQLFDELSGSAPEQPNLDPSDWLELAVKAKRKAGIQLSPDGWEIVDFLDSLGIYGDQGTIDVEMGFAKFFFFYSRYWYLLKPWIDHFRRLDGNVDYYRDIDLFWDEMVRYGKKRRGLIISDPRYSRAEILEFLDEEISGAPSSA